MTKILITHNVRIDDKALDMMRDVAQVTVLSDGSDAALLSEIRDASAVLLGSTPYIDKRLIESAGKLRHIARTGVGVDSIDLQAATERGIVVTNTPGLTSDSVAEFTMALLLSLTKNIPRCDSAVRNDRWDERLDLILDNIELNGKTHGIIGMGTIGSKVAVRCKAFGMNVLYYKRNRNLAFEKSAAVTYAPFETLLKESDSISLHLPLTNETTNLFDSPQFESMKRTALLINQSRGKVVNEKALVQALKDGRIGGYATDVFENEPPDPKSDLFSFKNVIVSPHLGGVTRESRTRASLMVAEEVLAVIRGDVPKNPVNREVLKKFSKES